MMRRITPAPSAAQAQAVSSRQAQAVSPAQRQLGRNHHSITSTVAQPQSAPGCTCIRHLNGCPTAAQRPLNDSPTAAYQHHHQHHQHGALVRARARARQRARARAHPHTRTRQGNTGGAPLQHHRPTAPSVQACKLNTTHARRQGHMGGAPYGSCALTQGQGHTGRASQHKGRAIRVVCLNTRAGPYGSCV